MTSVRLIPGDVLAGLATLPDASVHCCVTSPPYWGLRDYGVDGQLGLEPTPGEYVEKMVAVFREVRRVLRDDGTLWLNLGDSYSGSASSGSASSSTLVGTPNASRSGCGPSVKSSFDGLAPKNLVGIPWRVAFALQADGWYLRSDIIWAKPNPMPESVTDRPTKAHEYLFLLSKSERYHYDADAIAEPSLNAGKTVGYSPDSKNVSTAGDPRFATRIARDVTVKENRNRRTVWTIATEPFPGAHFAVMPTALVKPCILAGCPTGGTVLDPFGGSGTVAVVALEQGCGAILCELNPEYCAMIRQRVGNVTPSLLLGGGSAEVQS